MDGSLPGAYAQYLAEFLLQKSQVGVALTDAAGRVRAANPAFQRLTGCPLDRLDGMEASEFVAPSCQESLVHALAGEGEDAHGRFRLSILSANGLCHACDVRVVAGEDQSLLILEEAQEGPDSDDLSGAQTPEEFYENLSLELYRSRRYNRSLSIVLCGVLNYAEIRTGQGQAAADRVMAKSGWSMARQTRRSDAVARISQAELAVLLPETEMGGALTVAEKLGGIVKGVTVETQQGMVVPVAAFGVVTLSPEQNCDTTTLFETARNTLRLASQSGSGAIQAVRMEGAGLAAA